MPLCRTKKRTTNLKTKNNQNCQKIELYRSPTTKVLKKKYSCRQAGWVETGSWGGEDVWQGGSWWTRPGQAMLWLADWAVPH